MGTRGAYGFYKNGIDKITYNHFDSYPEGLGKEIVRFCKETSIQEMNEIFDRIELVDESMSPTPEQIERNKDHFVPAILDNGSKTMHNWYWLLRGAQNGLDAWKNGLIYMIDSAQFLQDSLFCEWAYVINLDKNVLEVYKGFQKTPQRNRYYRAESYDEDSDYYNCALIAEFPLNNIPENWIEVCKKQYTKPEEVT